MRRNSSLVLMALVLVLLLACGKSPQTTEQPATTTPGNAAAPSGSAAPGATPALATRAATTKPAAAASTIPAGDHIVIRLGETITSKKNSSGDAFSGTVAEPVAVNG